MSPPDLRREYDVCHEAHAFLAREDFDGAVVAIQTGSGVPVPELQGAHGIPWSDVPGFASATAPGHRGALHVGELAGRRVLVLEGRLHAYEGWTPHEIVRPVRTLALLGVPRLIVTNASGAVRRDLAPGTIVRVSDHINLMGFDPLTGLHDPRFGERFPVTAGRAHDARLGRLAHEAAAAAGLTLADGVYAALHGPSFETAAEVARLRAIGADLVGMSTVPEVLAANQLGLATLVLSVVANPAGEVAEGATAEQEVLDVVGRSGADVVRVIRGVVERLDA